MCLSYNWLDKPSGLAFGRSCFSDVDQHFENMFQIYLVETLFFFFMRSSTCKLWSLCLRKFVQPMVALLRSIFTCRPSLTSLQSSSNRFHNLMLSRVREGNELPGILRNDMRVTFEIQEVLKAMNFYMDCARLGPVAILWNLI